MIDTFQLLYSPSRSLQFVSNCCRYGSRFSTLQTFLFFLLTRVPILCLYRRDLGYVILKASLQVSEMQGTPVA